MSEDATTYNPSVEDRITEYLAAGGLFNPEMMEHDKVRDLLVDCRAEIQRLSYRGKMDMPPFSLWEFHVMLDALHGSLTIHDRMGVWRWSTEQRQKVLDRIYTGMNERIINH